MRLLILGGTTEASALARRIADRRDLDPVLSLAGRTRNPVAPPIAWRVGGFGGVDGLKAYLAEHGVQAVIDATHPFAAQISRSACVACRELTIPRVVLSRPPWQAQAGDRWTVVADVQAAVQALGDSPRRVLLTVGGLQLGAFTAAPQHHYLVRTIETPGAISHLPSHRLITARGPFTVADEIALLRQDKIEVVVTKNSGGTATEAKITAARALGIEVVVVERPRSDDAASLESVDAALSWIDAHARDP